MLCAPRLRTCGLRGVSSVRRSTVVARVAAPDAPPDARKAVLVADALSPSSTDVTDEVGVLQMVRNQGDLRGTVKRRQDPEAAKPGVRDNVNFKQHWSVAEWRNYTWPPPGGKLSTREGAQIVLREATERARAANVLQDSTSATYWAYHVARLTFFLLQSFSAVVAQALRSGAARTGRAQWIFGEMSAEKMLDSLALTLPAEAIGTWSQDLKLIQQGAFKLPWDMTTFGHRQFNPLWVAGQARRFFKENMNIFAARSNPETKRNGLPYGKNALYPDYYQDVNFHYQTDGWFSSDSAKVYEASTESLFLGRQDAMQRSTLVPISQRFPGSDGAGLKVLEVAAGTGRFATFFRDNYPRADLAVTDLSPFYLEEARSNMAYWESRRRDGRAAGACEFRQCAAERLPFADASQDIVYSVYMFHEVPTHARDAAIAEMARVLKPGGLLVITDSMQFGDRAVMDGTMEGFTNLNEPHYPSYIRYDFGDAFKVAGLVPDMKLLQSASKTLSAVKVEGNMN